MNTITLIGLIFLGVLVIFLMIAYFDRNNPGDITKYQIIRFVISLCGGFSLAFIGGGVTFEISGSLDSGQDWALSSVGGTALFLVIWLSYGKYNPPVRSSEVKDGIKYSIPQGITFSQGINTLVKGFRGVVNFEDFTDEQKNVKLKSAQLFADSKVDALLKLRSLSSDLPDYNVTESGNEFKIIKKL